jgi:hypothetical protein
MNQELTQQEVALIILEKEVTIKRLQGLLAEAAEELRKAEEKIKKLSPEIQKED